MKTFLAIIKGNIEKEFLVNANNEDEAREKIKRIQNPNIIRWDYYETYRGIKEELKKPERRTNDIR